MSRIEKIQSFAKANGISCARSDDAVVVWDKSACLVIKLTVLPNGDEYKITAYSSRPGYTIGRLRSIDDVIGHLAQEFVYAVINK